jgi:hypothetical protein
LVALAGTLNYAGKKYPHLTGEGRCNRAMTMNFNVRKTPTAASTS